MKTLGLLAAFLIVPAVTTAAEDPGELIRLREQFQARVKQQVQPLQKVYLEELVKLEKRLIKDNRLESALAVQKEREAFETAGSDPERQVPAKAKSPEELTTLLENTTWEFHHERPGGGLDARYVILLPDNKIIFAWGNGVGTWKAIANNRIQYTFPALEAKGEMKLLCLPRGPAGTVLQAE